MEPRREAKEAAVKAGIFGLGMVGGRIVADMLIVAALNVRDRIRHRNKKYTGPLRDLPPLTAQERLRMEIDRQIH